MTYKTILVHVDDSAQRNLRLSAAARLAGRFEAHLVGLYMPARTHLPPFIAAELPAEIIGAREHELEMRARDAERDFEAAARAGGARGFEWRSATETSVEIASVHARYADLAIVGQTDAGDPDSVALDVLPETLALSCGRPVLVIPYIGAPERIGDRILVGWNGSREATRALTDALPLMRAAHDVTIMSVNAERGLTHGDEPGSDIALYLARHGVKASVSGSDAVEIGVGEWLLSRASDLGADLIVVGAYGHPRLREIVLGGVTRTLLKHMTVPVLLAH